mgnify:CR=1 FL=1
MKSLVVIAALLACSVEALSYKHRREDNNDDEDEYELDKHEGEEMNYDEIL